MKRLMESGRLPSLLYPKLTVITTTTIALLGIFQSLGQASSSSSYSSNSHERQVQGIKIEDNGSNSKWLPNLEEGGKGKLLVASAKHGLIKRMDLAVCLGQFDVHPNTIIRTGESQAIGGKYLQGIDLTTVAECQRLCCDTDQCDVYIFESKNSGYCYLFHCGSPENFHCKFTRHANYTSAVLIPTTTDVTTKAALTTSPAIVQISQQEWELSNLKLPLNGQVDQPISNAMTNSKNEAETFSSTFNTTTNGLEPQVKCGRFQFACHSGECIAVYNACDGIPQCEDGSDEGPECSEANSNSPADNSMDSLNHPITASNPVKIPKQSRNEGGVLLTPVYQQQLENIKQQQLPETMVHSVLPNREDANTWQNRQRFLKTHQQFADNPGSSDGHLGNDHLTAMEINNDDTFTAFVQNQQNPNADGGYIMPGRVENEEQQHRTQRPMLPPLPPPPPPPPLHANWPGGEQSEQQFQPQQQSLINTLPQVVALDASPQQNLQIPEAHTNRSNITNNSPKRKYDDENATQPVEKSIESEEYEEYKEQTTTAAPKKKHKHKKLQAKNQQHLKTTKKIIEKNMEIEKETPNAGALAEQQLKQHALHAAILDQSALVEEQYHKIRQSLALELRDHDGLADRPNGAILSLTFGLLITAAMAVVIGCRLRTVRRRPRRLGNKSSNSQDADFLVNGMYL